MKKITTLLAIGAAAIGIQSASAALITLQTNFDTTFDDRLTPPYVGNATLTYTAPSALADGVYGWDSLSGLTFNAYFPSPGVTFTNANLSNPTSDISVAIVGSEPEIKGRDASPQASHFSGGAAPVAEAALRA